MTDDPLHTIRRDSLRVLRPLLAPSTLVRFEHDADEASDSVREFLASSRS